MVSALSDSRLRLTRRWSRELTPEEAALVRRIGVFVTMRWLAIIGVLIASLLANFVFNISFSLSPIYIICALMVSYSIVFYYQARNLTARTVGILSKGLVSSIRRLLIIPRPAFLLTNAIKFTPQRGEVKLKVEE